MNLFRLEAINLTMEYTYRSEYFSFELLKIVVEICRSEDFIYFKSSVQCLAQILFSVDLGFFLVVSGYRSSAVRPRTYVLI